jgi:hypothetical protein
VIDHFFSLFISVDTDIFYVSSNKENRFKVSTSPPADYWQIHFSFTARKTTGNLSEPMYFVYPTYIERIISSTYSRYPLNFFYSLYDVNRSNAVYVMKNEKDVHQEISTISFFNSRFASPPKEIQTFYAIIGEGNVRVVNIP